jgi:hypothetical protein
MIRWPERAKNAIKKLFEPLQDIDVYVEDTNDEAFYRSLLNSASNGEIKIARVFAMGGRKAVLDAAAAHDHAIRRALFIIDGDISWVKGEPSPEIIGLHCHDAYCVENLILCEKALITLLSQEIAVTEEVAVTKLDYRNWLQSIEPHLLDLFAAFATIHTFNSTIATVSQGVGVLCIKHRSGTTELDPHKVTNATLTALTAAKAVASDVAVTSTYNHLIDRIKGLPSPLRAVSGKDYLLPLIDFHLQSLGCRIKRKSLRIRLASAGDMTRFTPLSEALKETARGYA